jgi:hypothetical protein
MIMQPKDFTSRKIVASVLLILLIIDGIAKGQAVNKNNFTPMYPYILNQAAGKVFKIAADSKSASIYVDPDDWKGVVRAAEDLGDDVRKVTGTISPVIQDKTFGTNSILVGTIGKSRIIDRLIAEKKIDVTAINSKWESFIIQTVDDHLVIAGSDKRGTIFGIYDGQKRSVFLHSTRGPMCLLKKAANGKFYMY